MIKLGKIQDIALYILFFSINFEVYDISGLGIFSVSKLAAILYFLTLLPIFPYITNLHLIKKFIIPLFILYLLISFMSLNNHDSSIIFSFIDITLFLNIFLFLMLINHERINPGILNKGLKSFAIGSVVLTILYYNGIGLLYQGGRVKIFGDNQNTIAIRLSISILIMFFYSLEIIGNKKKLAILVLSFIPMMLLFMFETGSRKGTIGLVLAFIVGLLFLKKSGGLEKKVLIWFLSFIISFYSYKLFQNTDVIIERFLQTTNENDIGGRDQIWELLLPVLYKNPFFGVGKSIYADFSSQIFGQLKSPHNVILEILIYSGIVGLIFFIIFLFNILKTAILNYKVNMDIVPLILLIPIFGLILGGQMLGTKLAWILFAYAASREFYTNRLLI